MRYIKILTAVLLIQVGTVANGQKLTESQFYTQFYSKLTLRNILSYKDKVGLFSIRMKTDSQGRISSYETSASVDTTLRGDIDRAFKLIDKSLLEPYGFKSTTLILPLIITNGRLQPVDDRIWDFGSGNVLYDEKLLPPLVMFLEFNGMIVN